MYSVLYIYSVQSSSNIGMHLNESSGLVDVGGPQMEKTHKSPMVKRQENIETILKFF